MDLDQGYARFMGGRRKIDIFENFWTAKALNLDGFHAVVGFLQSGKDSFLRATATVQNTCCLWGQGVTSPDRVQSNRYRYFCGLTLPATGRYHSDICK